MPNDYYTHASYPSTGAPGRSADMRAELDTISLGFDKLAPMQGQAFKMAYINSSGTAWNVVGGDGPLRLNPAGPPTVAVKDVDYLHPSGGTMTGNLNFLGDGLRITGDFSNAVPNKRLMFQTNAVNGDTHVGAIPSGTGTSSSFAAFTSADTTNASNFRLIINSAGALPMVMLESGRTGTGAYLPLYFATGGALRFNLAATENRFQADFSGGASQSQKLLFQTNAVNGSTSVGCIPNGTGRVAQFIAYSSSDADNSFMAVVAADAVGSRVLIDAQKVGTGQFVPMMFATGGLVRFQLHATQNRFQADFSHGDINQRLLFQTADANQDTSITIIPNGSARLSAINVANSWDAMNCSYCTMNISASQAVIGAGIQGSGAWLPLLINVWGSNKMIFGQSSVDVMANLVIHKGPAGPGEGGEIVLINKEDSGQQALLDIDGTNSLRLVNVAGDASSVIIGTLHGGNTGNVYLQTRASSRLTINSYGNIGCWVQPPATGISDAPLFMAMGDADTGIGWIGDGQIGFYSDGRKTMSYSFETLSIYGYNEGGEVLLWNVGRTKCGLLDYLGTNNPVPVVRLLNNGGGFQIFDGGTIDNFIMYHNGGGEYGRYIQFDANSYVSVGRLVGQHVAGAYVQFDIQVQSQVGGGKWWGFRNDGNAYAINGSWVSTSDIRLKRNVAEISGALDKLDAIRGYTYERTDLDDTGEFVFNPRRVGILAQEFKEVLPDAVFEADANTMGVDPMAAIGLLVQVCKELKAKVEYLEGLTSVLEE